MESYFFPLYLTRRDLTIKEAEKKERGFLLLFWGETEKGESYGGFFPFYGNLKNRFGRDEMNFFLWPLYSDSRQGESKTYSFLWPIVAYSEGGGREGFRVWPLAGYDQKENDYKKKYFLWPIFHFEKRNLYTDDPTEISMVLPLYFSGESRKQSYKSVIFPLFSRSYNADYNYTEWNFPWPFVEWGKGEDRSLLRIFPVYGNKHWEGIDRGYILWPVYWYVHQNDDNYQEDLNRFLLLSKDQTQIWKKEGERQRRLRVWPLFYYRHEREGNVLLYWPCLIPLDYEGVERNWAPLFSLYEYRRNPQGASESKFLWGFYVHRQNASRELYELSFFLTYYKAEEVSYFSVLKGLLEYRAQGSKRALRVLYSPWPVEWENPPPPREAIAEEKDLMVDRTVGKEE